MTEITPSNRQGGFRMAPEAEQVKDVSCESDQKHYVIRNVPFKVYEEYSDEEVYNSDVTLKLLILKDLMMMYKSLCKAFC